MINMKIVILAAGKGTRMGELTIDTPKPLLRFEGKSLIEHKLENIPDNTTEIIIVVGYFGDMIRNEIGTNYKNIPIIYVQQDKMLGTAHALWKCRDFLNDSFIVLMGDDLYKKEDLEKLQGNDWSILVFKDTTGSKVSKMEKNSEGNFVGIIEDLDGTSPHNLIYTGACFLTPEIFKKEMVEISNGEFGLPQTFSKFTEEINIKIVETNNWTRITSPKDLK